MTKITNRTAPDFKIPSTNSAKFQLNKVITYTYKTHTSHLTNLHKPHGPNPRLKSNNLPPSSANPSKAQPLPYTATIILIKN